MNQSYFKNRKLSIFYICLICLFFFSFISTNDNKKSDSFLTLCKNSDAYFLYSYNDVTYVKNWSRYKKYTSVNNKLVINNTNGVDAHAFLKLDEYESNHIQSIKIKTLKADGSVIELDSSLVFKKDTKNKKFGVINYPIPSVEPGDTIETSYVYTENLKKHELSSFVDLHKSLPSLNSQYSIKTEPGLYVRYKTYNNFVKPKIVSNDSLLYVQFAMDSIKGFVDKKYSCFPCELPYMYYSLENKDSKSRTWINVYNEEFNFLTQPLSLDYNNSTYYKRWKRRVIGKAKDSSKYYKFNLLFNEVTENFKIEPTLPKELIKSNGFFLKEKRFDPISIRRFYRQILEDLDIKYWAVFARSKASGPIDTDYIRVGEYDHIFFAYEDKEGDLKFLYPHNNSLMYQIDEIPTNLYNTKAVIVKPVYKETKKNSKKVKFITRDLEMAKVDSVLTSAIKLPGMNFKNNYINQTISGKINFKEKNTSLRYRFKVSGGQSTELRTYFEMINKNKELSNYYDALSEFEGVDNTIQIDTVIGRKLNTKKPFSFILNANGTLNNAIKFLNENMVSISIDKLLQHNQLESDSEVSELNYYLDYSYSDNFLFYLNFPSEIKILGLENGNINYKNEYGEYFFEIKKNKKNQVLIKSRYKIKEHLIPKEKYIEIKKLNEQVKNIKSKRLIIKLVK